MERLDRHGSCEEWWPWSVMTVQKLCSCGGIEIEPPRAEARNTTACQNQTRPRLAIISQMTLQSMSYGFLEPG